MDAAAVRTLLRRECDAAGGVGAWAKRQDVSPTYVHFLLAGERAPGKTILNALKLERIVTYRPKRGQK